MLRHVEALHGALVSVARSFESTKVGWRSGDWQLTREITVSPTRIDASRWEGFVLHGAGIEDSIGNLVPGAKVTCTREGIKSLHELLGRVLHETSGDDPTVPRGTVGLCVGELIEALKTLDPHLPVLMSQPGEVDRVEEDTHVGEKTCFLLAP